MRLIGLEMESTGEKPLWDRLRRVPCVMVVLAVSKGLRSTGGMNFVPALDALSTREINGVPKFERVRFYWFNADHNEPGAGDLCAGLGVTAIPSVVIFKDGREVTFTRARFAGIISTASIESSLDIILDSVRNPEEPQPAVVGI